MLRLIRLIYNLLFPVGFLFFLPGLLFKLYRRPGWKSTYAERFGIYSAARRKELKAFQNAVWFHAVSVGESVIALDLVKRYLAENPGKKAILSTGTTTGQELVRAKAPDNVAVIFCPIDYVWPVRYVLSLLHPAMLVLFETEIWPNLIVESRKRAIPVALVNARMSDHSVKGYRRLRFFFAPLLKQFHVIAAQSEGDAQRFRSVSPQARILTTGNLKFDQKVPENLKKIDWNAYFGSAEEHRILMGASTHPGEEALICDTFLTLKQSFPALRLVLVPRHAERGTEIAALLEERKLSFVRRSQAQQAEPPVECLLADTTGEMLALMAGADVVIMGKSLAGQNEGHNLIEPALLAKPIVTGAVLKNFRFVQEVLKNGSGVATVSSDLELAKVLSHLFSDDAARARLGKNAFDAIQVHAGAARKTLSALEELL